MVLDSETLKSELSEIGLSNDQFEKVLNIIEKNLPIVLQFKKGSINISDTIKIKIGGNPNLAARVHDYSIDINNDKLDRLIVKSIKIPELNRDSNEVLVLKMRLNLVEAGAVSKVFERESFDDI